MMTATANIFTGRQSASPLPEEGWKIVERNGWIGFPQKLLRLK